MRGSGDVGYQHGRMRVWGSVLFCIIMLFCRKHRLILGSGYQIQSMVTRSEEHITSLLLHGQLLIDRWLIMFGTGLFPQRCPCLCGASFAIDCLLKIIWQGGESFKQQTRIAQQLAVTLKWLITCSQVVTFTALFGHLCCIGQVFHQFFLESFVIIFCSLYIWLVCLGSLIFFYG